MFVTFDNEKYALLINTAQIASVAFNELTEMTSVLYLNGETQTFDDPGDEVTGISIYSTLHEALIKTGGR